MNFVNDLLNEVVDIVEISNVSSSVDLVDTSQSPSLNEEVGFNMIHVRVI